MQQPTIWSQMASSYDRPERVHTANIIAAAMRQELTDTKGKTAMDFGCGTGLVGLGLVDLFSSMLFVDFSPEMVKEVQQKIERGGIANASVLCCDFLDDTPPDIVVDHILLSQVLLHIKDTRFLLSRLYNALHEGGRLIVVDFDKDESIESDKVHNGFDQNELITLAKEIGFVDAHAHTFYSGERLFMNKDASMFILNAQK